MGLTVPTELFYNILHSGQGGKTILLQSALGEKTTKLVLEMGLIVVTNAPNTWLHLKICVIIL
jgi:hypothetical protein